MSDTQAPGGESFAQAAQVIAAMRTEIAKAVVGQDAVIEQVLCALLAGGHVLVEGVPGLGKTLLVRALAQTLAGRFGRIQFTPDLMPADVTGHTLYDPKSQAFTTRRGPVFCHLLLADEINRAPAKTQAALLEVMQEADLPACLAAIMVETLSFCKASSERFRQLGSRVSRGVAPIK